MDLTSQSTIAINLANLGVQNLGMFHIAVSIAKPFLGDYFSPPIAIGQTLRDTFLGRWEILPLP
jgi:hypothetical protein